MKDLIELTNKIQAISLKEVTGSRYCEYSVIENKLEILYKNQERLLEAIKLLSEMIVNK